MSYFENLSIQSLSAVEQEIYRYIINHPDKIPYMRVRDIAENSHTSATSVFRFINKIGFKSYTEFRLSFKNWLIDEQQAIGLDDIIENHFAILNKKNFNQDLAYQIEKISGILKAADRISLFGMGSSGSIAEYSARKIAGLGYDAIAITDFSYPINSHFSKKQKNVLMVYSSSGETKEIIEMMLGLHHRNSIFCCSVTKNPTGTIASLSDYVIDYRTQDENRKAHVDLSTQLPALFISELIIDSL